MKSDEHKLAWLQALRGVAALMVVFLHDREALKVAELDGAFEAMFPLGMVTGSALGISPGRDSMEACAGSMSLRRSAA